MKPILLSGLVLISLAAHGQQMLAASQSPMVPRVVGQTPTRISLSTPSNAPGYRQRNTGRTLTIIGGVMLVTGVVLVSTADATYYTTTTTSSGTYEEGDPKGGFGTLMIAGGLGMTIPGVILWSKGSKRYNRYLEKSKKVEAGINTSGVGLRYSF